MSSLRLSRRATVRAFIILHHSPKIHGRSHVLGEPETDVPFNHALRVCSLYAQLGVRGVSALHSSGDSGTAGCTNPRVFVQVFPSGCPYVTSIGGTYKIPETTVPFSGGGFSNCEYSSLVALTVQLRVWMR